MKTPDDLLELGKSGLTPAPSKALLAKSAQALDILRKAYPNARGVNVWHYTWAFESRFRWSPIETGPPFRGFPTLKGTIDRNVTILFLSKDNRLPIRPVTREEILRLHAEFWRKRKQEEAAKFENEIARGRRFAPRRDGWGGAAGWRDGLAAGSFREAEPGACSAASGRREARFREASLLRHVFYNTV
jgi:hypothetical protein